MNKLMNKYIYIWNMNRADWSEKGTSEEFRG